MKTAVSARLIMTMACAVALAACATAPNTYSSSAPGVDFSQYTTFGFYDNLSTDRGQYESLESNFLKVAVAQQLDLRGLAYTDESPDLIVNFYIHTEDKVRSRRVPTTSAYYGYRDPFYDPWDGYGVGMAYETRIDQYTQGTLNIDVVDAKSKKLVWEGAVTGRITEKDVRNMEKTIDEAVEAAMASFPVGGGTG